MSVSEEKKRGRKMKHSSVQKIYTVLINLKEEGLRKRKDWSSF